MCTYAPLCLPLINSELVGPFHPLLVDRVNSCFHTARNKRAKAQLFWHSSKATKKAFEYPSYRKSLNESFHHWRYQRLNHNKLNFLCSTSDMKYFGKEWRGRLASSYNSRPYSLARGRLSWLLKSCPNYTRGSLVHSYDGRKWNCRDLHTK